MDFVAGSVTPARPQRDRLHPHNPAGRSSLDVRLSTATAAGEKARVPNRGLPGPAADQASMLASMIERSAHITIEASLAAPATAIARCKVQACVVFIRTASSTK